MLKFRAALEADCKETPQELSSPGNALCVGEERGRHLRIRQGRAKLLSSQMELLSARTGSPTGLYLLLLQLQQQKVAAPIPELPVLDQLPGPGEVGCGPKSAFRQGCDLLR